MGPVIPLLYTIKERYVGERERIEEINCRQPVTVYWCNSPANVFISRVVQMRKITIVNNNCLVHKKSLGGERDYVNHPCLPTNDQQQRQNRQTGEFWFYYCTAPPTLPLIVRCKIFSLWAERRRHKATWMQS